MKKLYWTLGVFIALVALLAAGLLLNPREVPSPLIGKPAPSFDLPLLAEPDKRFSEKTLLGKPWVLNVWASWCPPCLAEHPVVSQMARSGIAPVVGLNYKDTREDALPWLKRNGNPFNAVVFDPNGRIGIDYGVYGVPETFVIDKAGVIRYKQIGPITPAALQNKILPLIEQLKQS